MKRCINLVFLIILFLLLVPSMSVFADTGPKPSVVIDFVGLEEEEYYVTLLSESTSIGPWSVGNERYEYMGDEAVFQKFSQYEDVDGYHFLGYMKNCSEDDVFEWTYHPPSPFKVLIYFPEHDSFLMDENVFERYAFDSYFTAEVTGMENIVVSRDEEAVIFVIEAVIYSKFIARENVLTKVKYHPYWYASIANIA